MHEEDSFRRSRGGKCDEFLRLLGAVEDLVIANDCGRMVFTRVCFIGSELSNKTAKI